MGIWLWRSSSWVRATKEPADLMVLAVVVGARRGRVRVILRLDVEVRAWGSAVAGQLDLLRLRWRGILLGDDGRPGRVSEQPRAWKWQKRLSGRSSRTTVLGKGWGRDGGGEGEAPSDV